MYILKACKELPLIGDDTTERLICIIQKSLVYKQLNIANRSCKHVKF